MNPSRQRHFDKASRQARSVARTTASTVERDPRVHLAQTLQRASQIAALKAAQAQRDEARAAQPNWLCTLSGLSLVILGTLGTLLATTSGLSALLGIYNISAVGVVLVAVGALLLTHRPRRRPASKNNYAVQALQLAQLSQSIRISA